MPRRLIVRPLAEADLADATKWYEEERTGLAARFLSDLDRTLARVQEHPFHFPAVSDGIHRALLHTFPYAVYFRPGDDLVMVLAVLHQSRNPKVWRGRTR